MCTDTSKPLRAGRRRFFVSGAVLFVLALVCVGQASAVPVIETWETNKGARVLFVEARDLPILDVRMIFDAGSARDGEQSGLASLTASMLTQGAGEWDADAIAERIESIGAQLSVSAARDSASLSLRTLTREPALGVALDTTAAILSEPSFEGDDLERVRENTLVGIRLEEQDPRTVGSKAIFRQIFGEHPYAPDPAGTQETLAALAREDLIDFHRKYYVARNVVVAIVGDLSEEGAREVAERLTSPLAAGEPAPELPPVADLQNRILQQLDFPSTQTHIFVGQPGIRRLDPDYFPLYVGNHILGGSGLVSLLMEEIREKRGLSYGAYSYFLPMVERGPFLMSLQTKNDQAFEARRVLMDTVRRFRDQGPTADELRAAIKNITGGFPLRISSNSKIVQYIAAIGFYGLPLDYLDTFTDRVAAVTKEQIREAFERRIDPDRSVTVMVGPRADGEEDGIARAGDRGLAEGAHVWSVVSRH